jgi:hypothetical protein
VSLDANRLKGAEYERLVHGCYPPKEHTIEDLKRPEYWAAVAPKLRPWNHIEVYAEDGTWYAHLLVLAVERAHAVVHVLRYDEPGWQLEVRDPPHPRPAVAHHPQDRPPHRQGRPATPRGRRVRPSGASEDRPGLTG